MREKIVILSLLVCSFGASAITQEERDVIQTVRNVEKTKFKSSGSAKNCETASANVKSIQEQIANKKVKGKFPKVNEDGTVTLVEGEKSLHEMEKIRNDLESQQILLNGMKALNKKYKDFLADITKNKIPGFEDSKELTLEKLEADIKATDEHLENVETMALMDQLLKESIKGHKNLLIDVNDIVKSDLHQDTVKNSLAKGDLDLNKKTSKGKTFSQLKDACKAGFSTTLCRIIGKAEESSSAKVKASVEGFVDAYRASNTLTKWGEQKRLKRYREALLDGVTLLSPTELSAEINKLKSSNEDFKKLVEDKADFETLKADFEDFKVCMAQKTMEGTTSSRVCKLANTTDLKAFTARLDAVGDIQQKLNDNIGGNNEKVVESLKKVHGHHKANETLTQMKDLYVGAEKADLKPLEEKIKGNKAAIELTTKNIFKNINDLRNDISIESNMFASGNLDDKMKAFFASEKGKDEQRPKPEDMKATNKAMNDLMVNMMKLACEKRSKGEEENSRCSEAKPLSDQNLFKMNGDKVEIVPDSLGHFIKEINAGTIKEEIDAKQADLNQKMADINAKIKGVKNDDQYKGLISLLSYYGDRVQNYCVYDKENKASWKCVVDKSGNNDKVYALVDEAGKIVASMPQSPDRMAISELNEKCSVDFINSFPKDSKAKKDIDAMCTDISKQNENYLAKLAPTRDEKIYPAVFEYWDGKDWITTEKRQRKKWTVIQSVAEGGLKFLPWELNRQMQNTQVDIWEQNTIDGITARNAYLNDYYTNGIFYPYPGVYNPYYLGSYGGTVYNNSVSTVGTGGFFPSTSAASTPVPSTGFDFSTAGI
ncbi:MAG: hypothetical protein CME70_16435 [Halobacteriovorax sp.]|nr:hypothetical protein [Halobacteriovorax sp.]|tara:strand:- start:31243 stop:33723 length:2481 start_codon:yes stop_codon:yes gene_type:complete